MKLFDLLMVFLHFLKHDSKTKLSKYFHVTNLGVGLGDLIFLNTLLPNLNSLVNLNLVNVANICFYASYRLNCNFGSLFLKMEII